MTNELQNNLKSSLSIIRNSYIPKKFNISVDYTTYTEPILNHKNAVYSKPLGNTPLLLKSLYLSYDSTFLQYYKVYIKLEGLNIDDEVFDYNPSSSSGFDYVPTGSAYFIPASSTLEIFAYNAGAASTNGILNVLPVFDRLDSSV